ncbi:sulfate transporter family protein [Methylocystis parvus]|uniref:Sulfate transporter family protein n=1 Tax=Methylocystis parvus TaxID=134 RepID=A0A6B8LZ15_9HYPH|nr:sulfate transporter family protein [Methylocystis parvus]QGM96704.1 sulfate transporter family protein [Methylocystis parvus]WBJ99430.1 sulfate transporter family protein [Methylocystis parvus OBBP]
MTFMFDAALAALREILSPPFRNVLIKSIGMTLLFLALAWVGLDKLALSYIAVNHPWLQIALTYATGVGLFLFLAFFLGPISVLVAGLFLDDLADVVEADLYPAGERGRAIPAAQAIMMGVRFAAVSAGVNLLALFLLLVPGINAIAFLLANAYLLGREYFLFAATRFRSLEEATELRRRYAPQLFLAGLFIAAFVMTPGLNVLTPLFGVAFMSRIHKMLSLEREARWAGR